MSSVDNRIVNMEFNNKQFTQGVIQSQRDLTGLDKTLANAGKSSGLDKMAGAAQQVSSKFSLMQVAGVTAVATIANKVTLAAGSMLKKLTIQPLIDGFKEYTTNLESVQTIMANTGKSVGTVNKYLDELNEYSDQTIYNFSQMAKNIGTFTAAGVELDTATSAIKGISNLAALSGSSSQQASTAMYQLSQAIAAGRVNLQDWNSVVNAGMGGKVFKNALAQTGVAMGRLSADAVKVGTDVEIMGESFRSSISAAAGGEAWLNSDILVTTLAMLDGRFSKTALAAEGYTTKLQRQNKMTEERIKLEKEGVKFSDKEYEAMVKKADAAYQAATQIKTATQLFQVVQESIGSMWAGAFEIILGDFKQSKKLWGDVGDVVLGIVDGISGHFLGALRIWEERGGRLKIIDGLANMFGGLLDILRAVADGFDRAFPDSNVSLLNRMSKAFFAFSEALVPSEQTLKDIGTIAEAVFSVLHFGFTIVKGVAKGLSAFFGALFSSTEGARGGILSMVASIAEVVIAVEDWLTSGSKITRFLEGLGTLAGTALSPIIATIGLVVDAFASLISGEGLGGAAEAFGRAKDVFGGFIDGVIEGLDKITAPFDPLKSDIADFAAKASAPFQGLIDKIDEVRLKLIHGLGLDTIMPSMEGLRTLTQRLEDGFIEFAESLHLPSISMDDLGDSADWVAEKFNAMVDAVGNAVEKLDIGDKIKSVKAGFADLFSGIGGGAGSAAAAGGAGAMAATAEGATSAWEKLGSVMSFIGGIFKSIASGIGSAFGWMVEKISSIPFPDDALEWATVLNALISGALIKRLFFSKGVFSQLAQTIKDIGKAGQESLGQLTNTLKTMQGAIKAELIKNIAIAVALLVASLVILSFIPAEKLANGLGALAAVMLMTGAMMQVMMKGLKTISTADLIKYGVGFALIGVGMMAMATAVLILTAAVAALAFIPFEKLKQGLTGVAIIMGIMVASLLVLSGQSAKVVAVGGAMVLMATAIDILVAAVIVLGLIPFETLKQGLTAVAYGIGIMTAALLVLSGNSVSVLAAGAAMVLMATALDILIPLIVTMGLLPWDVVQQGLTAVAWGLGMMTLALLVLSGGGASVMAAGAAMLMIAGALNVLIPLIVTMGYLPWAVVEQGLLALGIALTILVVAGALAMGVSAGLYALSVIILALGAAMLMAGTGMLLFSTGLALLVAVGVAAIGIIVLAIHAFIALLPTIAIQVAAAFVTFVQAIALAAPKIRKAMGTILSNMLGTIRDAIPEIRKLFETLSINGAKAVENTFPRWVETAWTLLDRFLKSIADHLPSVIESATQIAETFIRGLGDSAVRLANAGADALIDILNGFEDAVRTKGPQIRTAMMGLADAMKDEFIALTRDIFTSIPMPSLPGWMKDPVGFVKGLGRVAGGAGGLMTLGFDPRATLTLAEKVELALLTAGDTVAAALERAISLLVGGDGSGKAGDYARTSDKFQTDATYAQTRSGYLDSAATLAEERAQKKLDNAKEIKDQKKRNAAIDKINKKGAGKKAKDARAAATQMANAATKAQEKADLAAQQARDEISFNASVASKDYKGAGDVRSQQSQDLADRSQTLLAQAQAKADQADILAKGSKKDKEKAKKLREEARADANEANALAAEAVRIYGDAQAMYAEARRLAAVEVRNRMTDIRTMMAEQTAERAWQAEFESYAKEPAKQAAMLLARAEANETKAAAARAEMERQFAEAERLADTDAAGAMSALDEAERQASLANAAADKAEQDRQQIAQLLQQAATNTSTGSTSGGGSITPSRTAMEDASLAVDRYTTSLQQAEELAGASSSSTTFVQNNYSPEALSASDLYRQAKNLVSAAELKMAVTP